MSALQACGNVANTILAQLGGNHFAAMTGARHIMDIGSALQFKLPARFAKSGIVAVRIKLEASDTYTMTFYAGRSSRVVAEVERVYADQLRAIFTAHTGLHTSL